MSKLPNIEFRKDTHQYIVDGIEYPSVTTILSELTDYSFINSDLLDRAAKFGSAVHTATELYDKNNLDFSSLDAALLPYLEGWISFIGDYKPTFLSIEQIIASHFGYAGTLDRYASIGNNRVVIDIKSGSVIPKYTALQLSAYEQALKEGGAIVDKRYVVQLLPFTYKVREYSNKMDFLIFKSALNLYNWNKSN